MDQRSSEHQHGSTSTDLENAEQIHRENPRTFSIPRSDQRRNLQPGQLVKLIFLIDRPADGEPNAERMWVEVIEVRGSRYVGRLDNEPGYISNLKLGTVLEFGPEHVAAIYASSQGNELPYGKTVLVSRRIVSDHAWPQRVIRGQPLDETSSGWLIMTENEQENGSSDPEGFIVYPVDDILRQFRVLDSVLDEPVGTAWRWNVEEAEYQQE